MNFAERDNRGQIMSTDVFLSISSDSISEKEIEDDTNSVISTLKDFEKKYSRFIKGNFLDKFNESSYVKYDEEFAEILETAMTYNKKTKGIFNPTILPALKNEGYVLSKEKNYLDENTKINENDNKHEPDEIIIDKKNNSISKPVDLKIDLGGIGKGFIADKLAQKLEKKYSNFCISLGGDMYVKGVDQKNEYPYWAINVDSPFNDDLDTPLLLLKDIAVATSGVDKRTWKINGKTKNHIIDPRSSMSIDNEIMCATVVAKTVTEADIFAKTALILGLDKGLEFCENNKTPVIFILKNKEVVKNSLIEKYVWKE